MVDDLKRWRNIPDDFVLPVPEVARILDVSEEAIYSGVLGGYYVLLAPCGRFVRFQNTGLHYFGGIPPHSIPTVLKDRGHNLIEKPKPLFGNDHESFLTWIDVDHHSIIQWMNDKTIPSEYKLLENKPESILLTRVGEIWVVTSWIGKFADKLPYYKPPFLGVSGALLKRFLNEGFPPPADSPKVQEIEPPAREDARETMRAIVAGLLEEAGAAFLIERPTEAEASKASALLEAIERRRGKTIAPKTLSRYLRNWLRAED